MAANESKRSARLKRKRRIRKKLTGTTERPRLSVFRSARHIYAQVIDDSTGRTIVSASSLEKDVTAHPGLAEGNGKIPVAVAVGKVVAQRAMNIGLKQVVFDRNGFLYHGRVKAVSDGAREAGLDF